MLTLPMLMLAAKGSSLHAPHHLAPSAPRLLLGPGDYSIEETAFWSERVYTHVFRLLNEYSVVRLRGGRGAGAGRQW